MSNLSFNDWTQIAIYFVVLFALVKPLGLYMGKVYEGERTFLSSKLKWLERGLSGRHQAQQREPRHVIGIELRIGSQSVCGLERGQSCKRDSRYSRDLKNAEVIQLIGIAGQNSLSEFFDFLLLFVGLWLLFR